MCVCGTCAYANTAPSGEEIAMLYCVFTTYLWTCAGARKILFSYICPIISFWHTCICLQGTIYLFYSLSDAKNMARQLCVECDIKSITPSPLPSPNKIMMWLHIFHVEYIKVTQTTFLSARRPNEHMSMRVYLFIILCSRSKWVKLYSPPYPRPHCTEDEVVFVIRSCDTAVYSRDN